MELSALLQDIVKDAVSLKDAHTNAIGAPVNYACVFCHSPQEFDEVRRAAETLGTVLEETASGPLFDMRPITTVAGPLRLVKIRRPDDMHPDRGDADFTVLDYPAFKQKFLPRTGFTLIQKPTFEMIELMDAGSSVRAYFSHPPLEEQLGVHT